MSVELLISTFEEKNYAELLGRLNVRTNAVVINQIDRNSSAKMEFNDNVVKIFEFDERGSGRSRTNALLRATADFCVIADDDMKYVDDYASVVEQAFQKYPKADMLIFNLEGEGRVTKKAFLVRWHNFMRFGTAKISFRRESVIKNGIYFNSMFGAGAPYGSGEDTLFLSECLKKGLRIVAVPITIAKLVNERKSTWFDGYTETFLKNKGKLFACMNKRIAALLCFLILLKNKRFSSGRGFWKAYKLMLQGVREFR